MLIRIHSPNENLPSPPQLYHGYFYLGPVVAWLAVMQEGLLNLTQLNPALCYTHINKYVLTSSLKNPSNCNSQFRSHVDQKLVNQFNFFAVKNLLEFLP